MKTADFLRVLRGEADEVRETYASPQEAKAARQRASTLLRAVKDRYFTGIVKPGAPPAHRLNDTCLWVDPKQPSVLVCAFARRPLKASMYDPVLELPVGGTHELRVNAEPPSLHAKLRQLAAEVESEIGARPCWTAELLVDPQGRMAKTYRITRLPDDHDPATGQPRAEPTGDRKKALQAAWERMNGLEVAYDSAIEAADLADQPRPSPPQELLELRARLLTHDTEETTHG